jgi:myxalamid-type polyketide synthase MxaB
VEAGDYYQANLQIFDKNGQAVAAIEKLTLRPVSAEQLRIQNAKSLDSYEISWQSQPLEIMQEQNLTAKNWLIFVESGVLAAQFEATFPNAILVKSGDSFQKIDAKNVQINPMAASNYDKLLADYPNFDGIIHAWSENFVDFDGIENADFAIEKAQQCSCGSVLLLVQALKKTELSPSLTLITRGAQAVYQNEMPAQKSLNLLQAPLLGLAKVIVLEQPELHCLRLDLNPDETANNEAQFIIQELQNRIIAEDQIAYRQGNRYVPRLQKRLNVSISKKPRRLQLNDYGIDQLVWAETTFEKPCSGEIQIRVTASGLNFKDVLHALGMLKEPNFSAQTLPFGFECAGIVEQVGDGCEFNVGDRVMAVLTPASMADLVNVDARYVIKTPACLSDSDAAAIPLAYLTASYGLESLAKLKTGDRILIHAAAGGVGQAAIQIAQSHGLEIFATAHPDKWDMLKNQGIQHIYHSRHANYAAQILEKTNGKGVEIVLNSLTGDFIDENLRCLAQNGRFIEIGKLGIRSPEQMQKARPDVYYQVFELGEIGEKQPELIQALFQNLGERLQNQTLKPLPVQLYPLERAADAFHCMAKAQHRGKIVLTHTVGKILPQRTYLITGGLGGLGLKFAEWLISRGATHLVLNSLHAANSETQIQIEQLNKTATVEVFVANIGQLQDVKTLFANIQNNLPPLAGIIHAAGKIDDGMLQQLDWSRFESVAQPKINGSWYLHCCSQHLRLDFFVEFSSATALLGAPGQGNYAAANAFQDALAHYRKLKNLPALSINWGPWGEVGMAARLSTSANNYWQIQGISPLNPLAALETLQHLLRENKSQVTLMQIDWLRFSRNYPSALLNDLANTKTLQKNAALNFVEQLNAQPAEQQRNYLNEWLREQVCTVLELPKSTPIEPRQRLFDFGLDSLMAVELKNRLDKATTKKLRSTLIFDYPTLETLSQHLANQMLIIEPKNLPQSVQVMPKELDLFQLNDLFDALENTSDDEITQKLTH